MASVTYLWGCELDDLALTWYDSRDNLIDFSSGSTFTVKVGTPGSTALITKTSGITGAATSPNATVAWTTAELTALPNADARYAVQVVARRTSDSKDRAFPQPITLVVAAAII